MITIAKSGKRVIRLIVPNKLGRIKTIKAGLRFHGNLESDESYKKPHNYRGLMKKIILILAFLTLLFSVFLLNVQVSAAGLGNCGTGYIEKIEHEPFSLASLPGSPHITKVIVKAGSQNHGQACFEFTANGDDGCYSVNGFGTDSVSVTKIGDGRNCKDISHVEFYGDPEVTPTPSVSPSLEPSPSASASATPTPSEEPRPTPEVSPSPTATASASPSPSPSTQVTQSPSPTPSVEQQQQQMMEEVKKENGGVMPEIGFK